MFGRPGRLNSSRYGFPGITDTSEETGIDEVCDAFNVFFRDELALPKLSELLELAALDRLALDDVGILVPLLEDEVVDRPL
jgi:hypothetical protein